MYTLLSDPVMQRNRPFLILCNKQDQALAKGCGVIKILLEKEMNLLRLTKTNQLEATDASSANTFLGKVGKDFEFSHLDTKIEFAECSALVNEADTAADLEQLQQWIQKLA